MQTARRRRLCLTDHSGVAHFELPAAAAARVLVSGVERFHGRLDGEILVDLWSITQSELNSAGAPGEFPAGSNAYPDMPTRLIRSQRRSVLTDSEGYLVDPAEWSEGFAKAQAEREGLRLDAEHWEVIRYTIPTTGTRPVCAT